MNESCLIWMTVILGPPPNERVTNYVSYEWHIIAFSFEWAITRHEFPRITNHNESWWVRCLLITESPKTPSHFRYQIWVLGQTSHTNDTAGFLRVSHASSGWASHESPQNNETRVSFHNDILCGVTLIKSFFSHNESCLMFPANERVSSEKRKWISSSNDLRCGVAMRHQCLSTVSLCDALLCGVSLWSLIVESHDFFCKIDLYVESCPHETCLQVRLCGVTMRKLRFSHNESCLMCSHNEKVMLHVASHPSRHIMESHVTMTHHGVPLCSVWSHNDCGVSSNDDNPHEKLLGIQRVSDPFTENQRISTPAHSNGWRSDSISVRS